MRKRQVSSYHSELIVSFRMPEGLKNAGCTFSRMIAIVLHPQLRINILAYVDDIIIKSVQRGDHISDFGRNLRES
jgi:hypothetical protein